MQVEGHIMVLNEKSLIRIFELHYQLRDVRGHASLLMLGNSSAWSPVQYEGQVNGPAKVRKNL